jgi:hypothetical protein
MRIHMYGPFVIVAWLAFWSTVSENWLFPWSSIYGFVGLAALYWTGELMKPEDRSHTTDSETGAMTTGWLLTFLGYVFILAISTYLPLYWAQICPLLAIVVVYGVSRVCPGRKPEEKPEDALSQKDSNQGV